jgi:peroxiredoxin
MVPRRLRPNAGLSTRRFGEYPARVLRFAVIVVAACSSSAPAEPTPIAPPVVATRDVTPLYGTTPPAWQVERWIHSTPLSLDALRGKVVLVRWWTAGCPYCSASAPALRAFHEDYGPKGLVVIGMYHHKGDVPFDPAVYEATATRYGFTFPLAFDPEWRTLHSWLGKVDTGFTSVTFLLDKHGVIRHVHPGGEYAAGEPEHAELDRKITELLAAE